jgi:hypothetical protein
LPGLVGVDARDCTFEVAQHCIERRYQRGPPRNHYIVEPLASRPRHDVIGRRAQSPANAVAFYGVAGLLCNGQPDPRPSPIAAIARLNEERSRVRPRAACGSEEIRASLEAIHGRCVQQPSGGQALASACAAGGKHLSPVLRAHSGTEAMSALADEFARLKGPFHGPDSAVISLDTPTKQGASAAPRRLAAYMCAPP